MKLIDSNLLIYAVNRDATEHFAALAWWNSILVEDEVIGLSWSVLLSFLRISTHTKLFSAPLPVADALGEVDKWLHLPNVEIAFERDDHWQTLAALIRNVGEMANLTMDAHLAALAISHGATLYSCDADFARFPGLRWQNPLQPTRDG